jgi:drug/metabolite transporter (DMT)-like permease
VTTRPGGTSAVARPPSRDVALMAVGLAAVSTSGPLIAATVAPALAIAFWRNAFATGVIAPYALWRHRAELTGIKGRELMLSLAAGIVLAAHFATWVPSLRYTSVASSTALVALQPVWTALIARRLGQHVPRKAWLGMAVAFTGVLVIAGVDLSLSGRALFGDVLALVGGLFAAMYVSVGSEARRSMSTTAYTLICYGFCAVLLGVVCLVGRQGLIGYSGDAWLKLIALTAGAQLLGHSVFNIVIKTTSPTVVSLCLLFEMPGAAVIAATWLGQLPPWGVLPAAALLLTGVGIVIGSGGTGPEDQTETPPR